MDVLLPFIMPSFLRQVGETNCNEATQQEAQAEFPEDRSTTPSPSHPRSFDVPEDDDFVSANLGVVPENLDMVTMVPDKFDHFTGAPAYLSAEKVDFADRPEVHCRFNGRGRNPASREEAALYLREARIALLDQVQMYHPLWNRVRMDGSLEAEESCPASDELLREGVSDKEAALEDVHSDGDW